MPVVLSLRSGWRENVESGGGVGRVGGVYLGILFDYPPRKDENSNEGRERNGDLRR